MSLEQDMISVPGQMYALLSVVGPKANQKSEQVGVKIRGVFPNREEAGSHAKRLHKLDPDFDIYVVDMYKWLLVPPDNTKIDDVHYGEQQLDDMIKQHRKTQEEAKAFMEERRRQSLSSINESSSEASSSSSSSDTKDTSSSPAS